MIRLGLSDDEKRACIARYRADHSIGKVFVLSPERFAFACDNSEPIEWAQIIQYRHFYRLLQEIDGSTLVVVNECLRTQNRSDLTYNCIRHFLQQTTHQIVFQHLPIIDTIDDFMVLLDFDTRSEWKRQTFEPRMLDGVDLEVLRAAPVFSAVPVETDEKTRTAYTREKRRLIDGIGLRDPHTIPRNLLLMAGKAKLRAVEPDRWYIGRNNRFGLERMLSFKEPAYPEPVTVFEPCHAFVDFAGFLALSRQTEIPVLVSDIKVDRWYFDRFTSWAGRICDAYAAIHR